MSTQKKYAAIAATLGWTEYEPQEDGLFLQPEEAEALNTALANTTADKAAIVAQLDSANLSVQQLTEQMPTMHSQESVNALNAKITTLEEQVKELGGAASGNGSTLKIAADEVQTGAVKKELTLNDPQHPANIAASNYLAAKANAKKVKNGA